MKKFLAIGVCLGFIVIRGAFPGEKTYSVEIKDGVRYVHNFRPVLEKPSLGLKLIGKIGELEPQDQNYIFAQPISAAEDDKGNIFILDGKDACVKKFGPDRVFLSKFGRKGQGPGEFQYPGMLGVENSGRIVVATMTSDIHIFDNDGKYVDRFRLPPYQGISPTLLRGGRLVAYGLGPENGNSRKDHVFKVFDFKGQVQQEFGEPFLLDSARHTWNANFPSLAADGADGIYAAFLYQNRIEKYSQSGRLQISIERTLPYGFAYKYKQTPMDIGGKVVSVEATDYTIVHRGIGIDAQGRIWVLTARKTIPPDVTMAKFKVGDFFAFDVYDKEGIWTMNVSIPEDVKSFDNISMHREHVFFVDPYDQTCVHIYKIVERSE